MPTNSKDQQIEDLKKALIALIKDHEDLKKRYGKLLKDVAVSEKELHDIKKELKDQNYNIDI